VSFKPGSGPQLIARAAEERRTLSTMIELLLERGVEKKD
jgi:hypothetical protein